MKSVLCITLFLLGTGSLAHAQAPLKAQYLKQDVIQVVGTGQIEMMPDMATVHMTVVSKDSVSRVAQNDNAKEIKRLKSALTKKYELTDANFKTTSFTVSPDYTEEEPRQIVGYTVRHALALSLPYAEGIGGIVEMAVKSGADEINYIMWGLKNQRQYELEALKLAMQDAQVRAQAIAEATGRTIKRVIKVSQGEYSVASEKDQAAEESNGEIITEIFPETVFVRATLNVEFGF